MFKQILAATLLSTSLIAATAAPVFANQDGGDNSTFWADRAAKAKVTKPDGSSKTVTRDSKKVKKITHRNPKGKVIKEERIPKTGDFASVRHPDGSTTTVRRNSDGSKTITIRDADGKIKGRNVVRPPAGPANPPANPPVNPPAPRGTSWAHNHTTDTTSVGIGGGVHIVFGPLGITLGGR